MKKLLYIILILAVIGGGAYAWFYFSKPASQNNTFQTSTQNTIPSTQIPSIPSSYSIADTFPKTETISIGTGDGAVEVKNFYKTLIDTEEGFIIMADNENYQIFYDRSTSVFYIDLRTETALQTKAESDFLSILGISQQDACKLNVLVFQAGQSSSANLSFCANR